MTPTELADELDSLAETLEAAENLGSANYARTQAASIRESIASGLEVPAGFYGPGDEFELAS